MALILNVSNMFWFENTIMCCILFVKDQIFYYYENWNATEFKNTFNLKIGDVLIKQQLCCKLTKQIAMNE